MADRRIGLIEEIIEQYIVLHHEIALVKKNHRTISSKAQLGIISILHHYGGQSVSQLAEMTNTTSGAVSQIIDHLAGQELVGRINDKHDKRVVKIVLTKLGKEQYYLQRQERIAKMSKLFNSISDEELAVMVSAQAKLLESVAKLKTEVK